ncbi:MAG: hypothetical protein RLY31_1267 [Bacteroidota bacterium]|jgi:long-subunit fatty acid transport protein
MRPLILLALLLTTSRPEAQTIRDVIRYSMVEPGGTARNLGVGGAMGALGADFSVLSTNPAGLAAFRRSEFTFSPALSRTNTRETLEGEDNRTVKDFKTKMTIANAGMVIASRPLNANWTNKAFGFGVNQVAYFHRDATFDGRSGGSVTDRWLELSQGLSPQNLDPFEGGPAYDAEAIFRPDPDNFPRDYASDFPLGATVQKSQTIRSTGTMPELVFSYAGNYRERLMVGMTLGLPFVTFEETRTYREVDEAGEIDFFEDLTYTERLRVSGTGLNMKAGLIFRASQLVRLGAAVHTPTVYGLDEGFSTETKYNYLLNGIVQNGEALSPEGSFQYRIRSPWRFIGSAGFIFGRNGFVSAEVEWLDYSLASFRFNQTSDEADLAYEAQLNQEITILLRSALNLRLGGEFVWETYRVRGGYAYQADPFQSGGDPVHLLSMGGGIRGEYVFLDLAWQRRMQSVRYEPYLTAEAPFSTVQSDRFRNHLVATIGVKF